MGIFRQFPYSNFHDMNMDQIIKIMREMQDEWAATKNEWASYKDYIDNYFANLDVSDEVLQALRVMASDGTLAEVTNPQIAASVTTWLNEHVTPTTPAIDTSLTISGAAADSKTVGDWLFPYMDNQPLNDYIDENLEDGYWSTTNGQKISGGNYKSTRGLIRVHSGALYLCNYNVDYCMYDINRTFLGTRAIDTLQSVFRDNHKPTPIREDVAYIGINVPASATKVELHRIDSSDITEILTPWESENYLYKENFWSTATGTLRSSTTLSCIVCAGLPAGSRWYISNTASAQCACINTRGEDLTPTKVFDAYSNGYIYTIPADTAITIFNIYNSHTDAAGDIKVDYITRITQAKKILTIGDSITWLDGTGAGGMEKIVGYQRELRQMGYEVDKRAWSGFSYTDGVNPTDPTTSLYNEIVDNQLDVSGYEYIAILGGTNDISYTAPIGSTPNDYEVTDYNDATMCGAISGILRYIRMNNPDAKIMLLNPPKSDHSGRKYLKAKQYIDAINTCAEFWDCALVDLWHDMQVSPEVNYENFFYDSSHPNYFGMRRIGTLLVNRIKALYNGLVK